MRVTVDYGYSPGENRRIHTGYMLGPVPCVNRCRRIPFTHETDIGEIKMFIPSGYRVDLGNGEWLDNCKGDDCRLVPLPDLSQ